MKPAFSKVAGQFFARFAAAGLVASLLTLGVALPAVAASAPAPWVESADVAVVLLPGAPVLDAGARSLDLDVATWVDVPAAHAGHHVGFYIGDGLSFDGFVDTPFSWNATAQRFEGAGLTLVVHAPTSVSAAWAGPFFDLGALAAGQQAGPALKLTLSFADNQSYLDWVDAGSLQLSVTAVTSAVPEASALWMLAIGLPALGLWRRRSAACAGGR